MVVRFLFAGAASVGLALAQNSVNGNVGANNQTTPTAKDGDHTIHYVTVGKAENNFLPNSIVAAPGDIVTFQFFPTNHSVIKAAYGFPCVPYEDMGLPGHGFYSGPMPIKTIKDDPPTWNLTINDTQPVFYYCGAPGSCIDWGMVGVINANASMPLSTQIGLARTADFQLLPGEPFPNEAQQASMASLAATATTATLTVTATKAHESGEYNQSGSDGNGDNYDHHQDSRLSTGAIAGIAVGAAAVGIGAAALFFLMGRTRRLKRQLDEQKANEQPQGPRQGSWYPENRHNSNLPPYQAYNRTEQDMLKPPEGEATMSSVSIGTSFQNLNQGQFSSFPSPDPRQYRYTGSSMHTEVMGSTPPVSELAAPLTEPEMAERHLRYK